MNSPVYKKLNRLAGQAVHRFALIKDGDSILVGLSGGKDSLSLLYWLSEIRGRIPIKFKLGAAHLFMTPTPDEKMLTWVRNLNLDFFELAPLVLWPTERKSDKAGANCYVCAQARRKQLFDLADERAITHLALGHHQDDALETFLLNILYSGETSAILPKQELFDGRLQIIRPLFLVPESLIITLAQELELPIVPAACSSCGQTARQKVKELVTTLAQENPQVRGNIFQAMFNVRSDYLPN